MDDGLVADVAEEEEEEARAEVHFAAEEADVTEEEAPLEIIQDMNPESGQKFGPTAPAHPWAKPWTNLYEQEAVQLVKARSQQLKQPLKDDMVGLT